MLSRTTFAVCVAAALWLGISATAQAYDVQGDFVVGFSAAVYGGPAVDFEYDLGPVTAMTNGQQWDLGSMMAVPQSLGGPGYAAGFNSIAWSVLGISNLKTPDNPSGVYRYYCTYLADADGPGTGYDLSTAGNPNGVVPGGANASGLIDVVDTCITAGSYGDILSDSVFSWTNCVDTTDTQVQGLPNQVILNDPGYPGTPASGPFSDVAYVCAISTTGNNQEPFTFTFDSNGYLTYNTVAPLPGDANLDGRVDINDLTIVLAHYGQTGMTWAQGEFTGDGTVDINDLTIVLANYGQTAGSASPSAVPEPGALALLIAGIGGLSALAWWKR